MKRPPPPPEWPMVQKRTDMVPYGITPPTGYSNEGTWLGPVLNQPFWPVQRLNDITYYPDTLQAGIVRVYPQFENASVAMAGGQIRRTKLWFNTRMLFEVNYPVVPQEFMLLLRNFYIACGGDSRSFLFQDWTNPNPYAQVCDVGDGVRTTFKINGDQYDAIKIYVGGTLTTPTGGDPTRGMFTLATAPADGVIITADIENEYYRVTFHGFTQKHVPTAAAQPFDSTQIGGLAFTARANFLQMKGTPPDGSNP